MCVLFFLQPFDKQGFHAGTPPPFSLPSALGGTGPLTPGAAPGYAPAPFLHILPAHQQPHSQLLHHHLAQDGQVSPCLFTQSLHFSNNSLIQSEMLLKCTWTQKNKNDVNFIWVTENMASLSKCWDVIDASVKVVNLVTFHPCKLICLVCLFT